MSDDGALREGQEQPAEDRGTRLLEQSMTAMGTIQRRLLVEKSDDLDLLSRSMPRFSLAITQAVRLHHQIAGSGQDSLNRLAAILEEADRTDLNHGKEMP